MSVWINEQGQKHTVEVERRNITNSVHVVIDGLAVCAYRAGTKSGPLKIEHDYDIVCMTLRESWLQAGSGGGSMTWLRFEALDSRQIMRPVLIRADQVVSLTEAGNGWCYVGVTDGHRHLVSMGYGAVAQKLGIEVVA